MARPFHQPSNLIKPEEEGKAKEGKCVWESINKGSERKNSLKFH